MCTNFISKYFKPWFLICLLYFFTPLISAQQLEEMRAVKITNVDSYVLFNDNSIAEAMDYLASININIVLPVVLNGGWTIYQSSVMDSLFGRSIHPNFVNRDPLERLIIEAHRNGIEVYPWFEYGFAAWYSGGTPPFGGHILQTFPNWASRRSDGSICTKNGFDWMSPINPDVQEFMNSLVIEVLEKYDVDGIEFSDRIPAMPTEGGYDSVTVSIYRDEHGGQEPPQNHLNSNWVRWRADKLSAWYKGVRDIIKSYDEGLFVSSSPSLYPWAYNEYLQDSKTWIDSSIIDHLIPQLYRYSFQEYLLELDGALSHISTSDRDKVFAGILMNIGTGSNAYLISPEYLKSALQANRDRGVKGEGFFYYEGLRKNNNQLGDTLKNTFYNDPAIVPLRNGNIRRPKASIEDNTDLTTIVNGNWESLVLPGVNGEVIWTNDNSNFASVEYYSDISYSAYFDLYINSLPISSLTENANITIYTGSDSTIVKYNQSDVTKRGWTKIGTEYFPNGFRKILKIDNTLLENGKYLMADAFMLMINRKLSPNVLVGIEDQVYNEQDQLPADFELYQNYPNPFNPTTNIKFAIPSSEHISIKVYDILGRLVDVLIDDQVNPGVHELKFTADEKASGIYILRMSTGKKSLSRKMLLIK